MNVKMMNETKKISFGFSKISKKNTVIQPKKVTEEKGEIQFIDCLEENSIKLIRENEEKKNELPIIPMLVGNLLQENIKEVVKTRSTKNSEISIIESKNNCDIEQGGLTLDELAARELLEDSTKNKDVGQKDDQSAVPLQNSTLIMRESTLEDYESMPISDFGLAMLRGMGWDPKKGIGLNGKIVTALAPSLRPKGMGLGADKVQNSSLTSSTGELLPMKKGASVKVLSGPYSNLYGKIEGFDDLPGRLMVRIFVNNLVVSLNEIMVRLVSEDEVSKNIMQVKKSDSKSEKSKFQENQSSERQDTSRLQKSAKSGIYSESQTWPIGGNQIHEGNDTMKKHDKIESYERSLEKNKVTRYEDISSKNRRRESGKKRRSGSTSENETSPEHRMHTSKRYKDKPKTVGKGNRKTFGQRKNRYSSSSSSLSPVHYKTKSTRRKYGNSSSNSQASSSEESRKLHIPKHKRPRHPRDSSSLTKKKHSRKSKDYKKKIFK